MDETTGSVPQVLRTTVYDLFLGGDRSSEIGDELDLMRAGVCDSMGLVELATALERVFPGLRIPDQDITYNNFGTIGRMEQYVSRQLGA